MGLDIGLKKFKDFEGTITAQEEYREKSEKIWDEEMKKLGKKEYGELLDSEKEGMRAKCAALAEKMGLNEDGDVEDDPTCIKEDSAKHPKHYWKIGYFRSSYNRGGFNTILQGIIGTDL